MPYQNTLRSIPTFRPAALVFGPSATDRLIGDLRRALDARPGYADLYGAACAQAGPGQPDQAAVAREHANCWLSRTLRGPCRICTDV